jgi:hypothetical protein
MSKLFKVFVSILMALALVIGTAFVNLYLPDVQVKLSDVMNAVCLAAVVSAIGISLKKLCSAIKSKFNAWVDEQNRETSRLMLQWKMFYEYGIDINDPIPRGDPLKLLINDVHWMDKFDKYKYSWGTPYSEGGVEAC